MGPKGDHVSATVQIVADLPHERLTLDRGWDEKGDPMTYGF